MFYLDIILSKFFEEKIIKIKFKRFLNSELVFRRAEIGYNKRSKVSFKILKYFSIFSMSYIQTQEITFCNAT